MSLSKKGKSKALKVQEKKFTLGEKPAIHYGFKKVGKNNNGLDLQQDVNRVQEESERYNTLMKMLKEQEDNKGFFMNLMDISKEKSNNNEKKSLITLIRS